MEESSEMTPVDIVERLRSGSSHMPLSGRNKFRWIKQPPTPLELEAADEIERLRAQNQAFRNQFREVDELVAEWDGHTPSNPPSGWVVSSSPFEEDYWT